MQYPTSSLIVDIVIVAHNQAGELAILLAELPRRQLRSVIVVDNGSSDSSAAVARDAGAVVLREPRVGRGSACLRAIGHLAALPTPPEAVVFMSADGSDLPADLPAILAPICDDNAELVLGLRSGSRPRMRLVTRLLGAVYRHRLDDIGPFRAIRFPALIALSLTDGAGGFDVEMVVKAIKLGLRIVEVPVHHDGTPRSRLANNLRGKELAHSLGATGRALFHIVRHSTSR
ncbi:MAG: glycosyltransferase family 2 protein [Myxococcota bacterium]